MLAVDTNILIYAHNPADALHAEALDALRWLRDSGRTWALPLPCLVEFVRLTTHPRVLAQTMEASLDAVASLMAAPGARVIALESGAWPSFAAIAQQARATGNLTFDAHIAAACRTNGVSTILTEDRDFKRFEALRSAALCEDWRKRA